MAERDATTSDEGLRDLLRATRVGRHERVDGRPLDPVVRSLRAWQSERLARTYADLLDDPRYAEAGRFFLDDVYAAKDFSQRDHDVTRMYETMRHVLPSSMRRALELVIELNALTVELDAALAAGLVDPDAIDGAAVVEAYRRNDAFDERRRQIDLVVAVGSEIDVLLRKPGIGLALRLARVPARLAGWHELQDFFERGFAAFAKMRGAGPFLEIVASRERAILARVEAGDADAFDAV